VQHRAAGTSTRRLLVQDIELYIFFVRKLGVGSKGVMRWEGQMNIEGFIEIESIDWQSQASVVGGRWWASAGCAGCVHSTNS
jgi:hypothetical protein